MNTSADPAKERAIPVAYEDIVLTDEAAEILEKARAAAAERPARPLRRVDAASAN